jgi:hypothetical protein
MGSDVPWRAAFVHQSQCPFHMVHRSRPVMLKFIDLLSPIRTSSLPRAGAQMPPSPRSDRIADGQAPCLTSIQHAAVYIWCATCHLSSDGLATTDEILTHTGRL